MRRIKLALAFGVTTMLASTFESPVLAQQANCRSVPSISISKVAGGDSYISSHILVSENAYLFVFETDLNGLTEVLYPDSPGGTSKVAALKPFALPSFFSGFDPATGGPRVPGLRGTPTSRGTILALASCTPFSLDRITTDGEWNMQAIQSLINGHNAQTASELLANYLGASGALVGRNVMGFRSSGNVYAGIRSYQWW